MSKEQRNPPKAVAEHVEEARETAGLYALGALTPGEVQAFEAHLDGGCSTCEGLVAGYRDVVAAMGSAMGSSGPGPPPGLREKLLDRVRTQGGAGSAGSPGRASDGIQVWKAWTGEALPRAAPGLSIVRSAEGRWEPTAASGVSVKPLHVDAARRYVTMLVRMEPGASYPGHRHAGAEECLVLEGDLRVGGDVLRAGDYQCAEADSRHGLQSTEGGCLLLVVSSQDDAMER